ncbi:hypothetical protein BDW02DRAFT_486174 [Decorospora gaudefroyi]|uniref:F-box domain-containing protein n=1 Tax=Decorospora gaudefroyi TaxID=184978 RepID=A0A6A5KWL8_9PLEO|nr:hypothetical protein BDW02DRAFT_486174 [Decorospora gaudefroyi]
MVGLLDLSSELLFQIVDLVLSSPIVLPRDGVRHRPAWKSCNRNLYCIPDLQLLQVPQALKLLLVNRRMKAETREYLFKATQITTFKFDLAIVNDHWFWPTWRIVPIPRPQGVLNRFEMDVLPCCTEDERHLQNGWESSVYNPDGRFTEGFSTVTKCLAWELISPLVGFLLNRTLDKDLIIRVCDGHYGPLPIPEDESENQKLPITRINTLAIRIDTTRYGSGNELLSEAVVPLRKIDGLAHLDFERLFAVDLEKSKYYLYELKECLTEWALTYGAEKATKRLGKVLFYLDEELVHEIDFAKRTGLR